MCDNSNCKFAVLDSIGHEIKATNHIMQRKMIASAAKAGIDKVSVMHGWIIGYLYVNRDHDIFQKDVESEFAISRSTVTNIVKLMEKKGYIRREAVETDARLKKLELTDKGIQTFNVINQTIQDNEKKFNSILTEQEKADFIRIIRKLKVGIENFD